MTNAILVPIDLGHEDGQEAAADHASMLARTLKADLHVLAVIPDFGMPIVASYFPKGFAKSAAAETQEGLDAYVAAHFPDAAHVVTHVRHGSIYKEIIAVADKIGASFIVMTSHRPGMQDYLLGPNAARVVRHAKQSVAVIR